MKTIIEGNKERLKAYKYFECNKCGWAGKADKEEYKFIDCYQDAYYYVVCPCCNNEAHEVSAKRRDELHGEENRPQRPNSWAVFPPGVR